MKPLLVSVDVFGAVHFLERFPDDEDHAGLHEMLEEANGEIEVEDAAGVYLAHLFVDSNIMQDPQDDRAYLEIEKMHPVTLNVPMVKEYVNPKPENLDKASEVFQNINKQQISDRFFEEIEKYMDENAELIEALAREGD